MWKNQNLIFIHKGDQINETQILDEIQNKPKNFWWCFTKIWLKFESNVRNLNIKYRNV